MPSTGCQRCAHAALRRRTTVEGRAPKSCTSKRSRLERVKGIEPSYSAWKAAALPLSYTRGGRQIPHHGGGSQALRRHPAMLCAILSSRSPPRYSAGRRLRAASPARQAGVAANPGPPSRPAAPCRSSLTLGFRSGRVRDHELQTRPILRGRLERLSGPDPDAPDPGAAKRNRELVSCFHLTAFRCRASIVAARGPGRAPHLMEARNLSVAVTIRRLTIAARYPTDGNPPDRDRPGRA